MSDTTLETQQVLPSEDHRSTRASDPGGARPLLLRYVWWLVGIGIVALSAAMVLILRTRPGYDPYGWLDWGYQTLRGSLNLGGAPSWKPFTYLFNVPYAIFGHYALWLWMLTAVAVSLAGAVFGGRIAYKLTIGGQLQAGEEPTKRDRYAAIGAAIFGGAAVLGITQYMHYVMSVQSDPMLVTTCLAAIDFYLSRRYAWAWWMLALTALGRPEVWPFAGLYALWAWRKFPSMRWMLYVGVVANAFLWFGVPTITNHRPNIAGQLALKSPRELHHGKIIGTWDRFTSLQGWPVWVLAVIGVAIAAVRRNRLVLVLAAVALGWVVVEIGFALHGFPGVYRYLFEPAGLGGVLAGVAVGWLLQDARTSRKSLPSWAGIPVAVVLIAILVPDAVSAIRAEHKDVYHERARTVEINKLAATINALGGYKRVLRCGQPVIDVEYASIMAWYVHLNTGLIGYRPQFELTKKHNPIVLFTAFPNGWQVKPYRTSANLTSTCASLNALYVPTAFHPQGVLIHK